MNLSNNIIGFHHVSMKADDLDKTIAFYKTFGFDLIQEWSLPEFNLERCVMLFNPSIGYYLEICDKNADIPTQGRKRRDQDEFIENTILHLCFVVQDAKLAMESAIRAGAKGLSNEAWEIELKNKNKAVDVRNSLVYGLDGEVIEFLEKAEF